MKTLTLLFVALTLTLPAVAQHADRQQDAGFRWYLAPQMQVSQINGEMALFEGIHGGWIINDHVTIGFEANELETDIEANQPGPDGSPYLYLWYGGLTAEYGFQATSRLRLAGRALVGGGEAHWRETSDTWRFGNREKDEEHTTSLVFEPGAYASYGVTNWLQVMVGGGYRYMGAGKSNAIDQADLRSFSGTLALRVGRF